MPKSNGHGSVQIPVRLIAERHILEDLGRIPSPGDYLQHMAIAPWMSGSVRREVPLTHLINSLENPQEQPQ